MQPNILLVVLDSVRARNTSLHGYERETTPFLERFADEATVYEQTRSAGMTSFPSHTSMFTGYDVEQHHVHDSVEHNITPGHTVWEKLAADYGYATGAFSYNANLTGDPSLNIAFETVHKGHSGIFPTAGTPRKYYVEEGDFSDGAQKYTEFAKWCLRQDQPAKTLANGALAHANDLLHVPQLSRSLDHAGDQYVDAVLRWTNQQQGPWAACVNLMDAHHSYYPRPEHDLWGGERLQRRQSKMDPHPWKVHGGRIPIPEWQSLEPLYDGSIRQLDAEVERLVSTLRQRGDLDDTLLVITSDHGEGFGEPSRVRPSVRTVGHVAGLHESLLHVPLIVSRPGQSSSETVTDLATLRKFHDVALAAANGKSDSEGFVPTDRPVLAAGSNLDRKLKNKDRAQKYCKDTDRFAGVVRAVYEQDGDTIQKHMTWGEDSATVTIESDGDVTVTEGTGRDTVEELYGTLPRVDMLTQTGGREELPEQTLNHLNELGYV